MSNPYVNNIKEELTRITQLLFFILEMICYSVLSFPTILMEIQVREKKLCVFLLLFSSSLPVKTT